jgi:hypothetical protein
MSQTISSGDSPATARSKFNSNATQLDAATAATAAETGRAEAAESVETIARSFADAIEATARAAADTAEATARTAVDTAEAASRAAGDTAESVRAFAAESILEAALVNASRPGDNPHLFSAALTGPPATKAALTGGLVFNDEIGLCGKTWQVVGAAIIAPRGPCFYDAARTYVARCSYRRFANPADPSGDGVTIAIRWLDANFSTVATDTILDTRAPTLAGGRITASTQIRATPGSGVIVPPVGTCYFIPYVQTFGLDASTNVAEAAFADITYAGAYTYSSDLSARVAALEATVAAITGFPTGFATLDGSGHLVHGQLDPSLVTWLLSLPTTLPISSGLPWLDGGVLSIS